MAVHEVEQLLDNPRLVVLYSLHPPGLSATKRPMRGEKVESCNGLQQLVTIAP